MTGLFFLILFLSLLLLAILKWYGIIFGRNIQFGTLGDFHYIYINFQGPIKELEKNAMQLIQIAQKDIQKKEYQYKIQLMLLFYDKKEQLQDENKSRYSIGFKVDNSIKDQFYESLKNKDFQIVNLPKAYTVHTYHPIRTKISWKLIYIPWLRIIRFIFSTNLISFMNKKTIGFQLSGLYKLDSKQAKIGLIYRGQSENYYLTKFETPIYNKQY